MISFLFLFHLLLLIVLKEYRAGTAKPQNETAECGRPQNHYKYIDIDIEKEKEKENCHSVREIEIKIKENKIYYDFKDYNPMKIENENDAILYLV